MVLRLRPCTDGTIGHQLVKVSIEYRPPDELACLGPATAYTLVALAEIGKHVTSKCDFRPDTIIVEKQAT